MNDSFGVRGAQSFRYLDTERQYFFARKCLPVNVIPQRFAIDELHGDERPAVLLADVIDGANARMVQSGRGPRLAVEALERLRLLGDIFREEF